MFAFAEGNTFLVSAITLILLLSLFLSLSLFIVCSSLIYFSLLFHPFLLCFQATAAGTLGGLVGGISLIFLPWTGIQAAYAESPETILELSKAIGILFFIAMIPVFIIFMASLKTAVPVSFAALLIVIALIVQGAAYLDPLNPDLARTKTCGALFIIVGVVLWFSALAVILQEEGIKILPVMPLPRME